MNCKKLHNEIIFFLEGDLSTGKQKEVEIHLDACDECRAFAEEVRLTLNVIDGEKNPVINPYFYTKVKAKIQNSNDEKSEVFGIGLRRVLQPAIFSILLLIGIYSGIKIGGNSHTSPSSQAISQAELIPYLNELNDEPIESFLMQ